ncbi:hypothetical protein ACWEQL_40405 [Kitasatospora sp. NPDC004240]
MPDEVRSAAVRAVLCLAFTLVWIMVATLASYAGRGLLTPALLAMALGVFGTAWCLLEIVISRQIAAQRMRGPHSATPMAGSRVRPGPAGRVPPPGPPGARPTGPGGAPATGRQPRLPTA